MGDDDNIINSIIYTFHSVVNPLYREYLINTTQTIRVVNSVCGSMHVKHGNCHGHKNNRKAVEEEIKAAEPLPKCKRHK